jgi:hypothetical protein
VDRDLDEAADEDPGVDVVHEAGVADLAVRVGPELEPFLEAEGDLPERDRLGEGEVEEEARAVLAREGAVVGADGDASMIVGAVPAAAPSTSTSAPETSAATRISPCGGGRACRVTSTA